LDIIFENLTIPHLVKYISVLNGTENESHCFHVH